MKDEIQLISDGDGLAVIGSPTAVELFLTLEGLAAKDLGLPRLAAVGRWVELTKEPADLVEKHGLRKSSTSGLSTGVVKHGKARARLGSADSSSSPRIDREST